MVGEIAMHETAEEQFASLLGELKRIGALDDLAALYSGAEHAEWKKRIVEYLNGAIAEGTGSEHMGRVLRLSKRKDIAPDTLLGCVQVFARAGLISPVITVRGMASNGYYDFETGVNQKVLGVIDERALPDAIKACGRTGHLYQFMTAFRHRTELSAQALEVLEPSFLEAAEACPAKKLSTPLAPFFALDCLSMQTLLRLTRAFEDTISEQLRQKLFTPVEAHLGRRELPDDVVIWLIDRLVECGRTKAIGKLRELGGVSPAIMAKMEEILGVNACLENARAFLRMQPPTPVATRARPNGKSQIG